MPKTEIITRALNRLEYTVMCIRGVHKLSGTKDYKHIVINQGSTDGTKQWLDSLLKEKYYQLEVKHNEENSGDAGGMKQGWEMLSDDCKYVMQFDNDCEPVTSRFLFNLTMVMDNSPKIGALMMKRLNVNRVLTPKNVVNLYGLNIGEIETATCCTIFRRKVVEDIGIWFNQEKIGWGQTISKEMKKRNYKICKCLDIKVNHIDGSEGQARKYPLYYSNKTTKQSNYTKINYGD